MVSKKNCHVLVLRFSIIHSGNRILLSFKTDVDKLDLIRIAQRSSTKQQLQYKNYLKSSKRAPEYQLFEYNFLLE